MPSSIISLKNITRTFKDSDKNGVTILDNLNLTITKGSFNVIRGESGSGKTTILRIIGLLDYQFEGDYELGGLSIKEKPEWYLDELRAENIGFIFQDGKLFNHLSIEKNILVPYRLHDNSLSAVNLEDKLNILTDRFYNKGSRSILKRMPSIVSGGEKQRASIMRSIMSQPSIILADEPTASLNGKLKNEVVKYLELLSEDGHTVVVVSHDSVFYGQGKQYELLNGKIDS